MSENAITPTNNHRTITSQQTWQEMREQASVLVQSGFLPNSIKRPEQALAIMTMANELQIGIWAGFNGINVIQGKPTISPQLMLALINRSGELEELTIKGDDKSCSVTMKRKGRSAHTETFTMEDAARMRTKDRDGKVIPLSQKYNWRTMPAVMLKWRAVSACARVVFSDVIIGFYTPEEINPDLEVDAETGEIINENGRQSVEPPAEPSEPPQDVQEGELVEDAPQAPQKAASGAQAAKGREFPPRPWEAEVTAGFIRAKAEATTAFSGPASAGQVTKLIIPIDAEFKDSATQRKDRLAVLSYIVERDLTSAKELLKNEASAIIGWQTSAPPEVVAGELNRLLRAALKAQGQTEMELDEAA